MSKRLLTVAETAEYLGLSQETVRRLYRGGSLHAVYLTERAVRLDKDELDRFIERRTA